MRPCLHLQNVIGRFYPKNMLATVKYQVATYSGEVKVNCSPNDEDNFIIAKAKKILRQSSGSLPFGYESWKVVNREYEYFH